MSKYSQYLYVRTVNPGTPNEYQISGTTPDEVDDDVVGNNESVDTNVARYVLAGIGTVHTSTTTYVEHTCG